MNKNPLLGEKMDNRRKPDFDPGKRKIAQNVMSEDLMKLVLEADRNYIKDTILKIRLEDSYDQNVKSFASMEVPILKDTVKNK